VQRRRLVRVPASSANLGPGFDALAAALALHLDLEVVETGTFAVETDLPVATDDRNLVVRGFAALAAPDDFTFRIRSEIPLSGGLGTSAAAYVAGLLAADHLFELDADVQALATGLEGHPDNVAAALQGGFVVCTDGEVTRFDAPAGLEAVLVVPHDPVRTREARACVPDEVPLGDAVFSAAHAALLVLGLSRGDWELVSRGLRDRLHQPRRRHLYPRSMALVDAARDLGALGATLSGAGPTVLVWCHMDQTPGVVAGLRRETAGWADVLRAPFEPQGADVREL
jgi:homoserine kinase